MRASRPARNDALYRRGWRIRHQGFGEHGEEALRRLAAVDPGHARAALRRGLTRKQIVETIVQVAPYAGFPVTNHGLLAAQRAFDAADRERKSQPPRGRSRRGRAPA